jgi:hypothetical protein
MKSSRAIFAIIAIVFLINRVEMAEVGIATYEEIKELPNHPEKKLLIDVREPHELAATGSIPTAINIPRKSSFTLIVVLLILF